MNDLMPSRIQVTDLLDVLRSGLAVLVPVVERLAIPWTDGEAYDDWEKIASTLYDQLVVNTAQAAIEVTETLVFPKYDLVYPSYEGLAHFEVISKHTAEVLGIFVGFAGMDRTFSRAKYAVRCDNELVDTTETKTVVFADCKIRLRLRGTEHEYVEVLTIP